MTIYSLLQANDYTYELSDDGHTQCRVDRPVIIPIQCGQQASDCTHVLSDDRHTQCRVDRPVIIPIRCGQQASDCTHELSDDGHTQCVLTDTLRANAGNDDGDRCRAV